MKKEKSTNLIVDLLKKEHKALIIELKKNSTDNIGKIKLKSQIEIVIKSLEFLSKNNLLIHNMKILQMSESGSESYFTEFYIVDENFIKNNPKIEVKKDKNGKIIKLNCFDLILQHST